MLIPTSYFILPLENVFLCQVVGHPWRFWNKVSTVSRCPCS